LSLRGGVEVECRFDFDNQLLVDKHVYALDSHLDALVQDDYSDLAPNLVAASM